MKNILIAIPAVILFCDLNSAFAQTTISLPVKQDAMVRYFGSEGDIQNFGDYNYANMHAWTNSSTYVVHRSLIDFDIISMGSVIIDSATLKLFTDRNSMQYPEGHQHLHPYNTNECVISRITKPWKAEVTNWTIMPKVTYENQVYLEKSTASFENYQVDVTQLVQDYINNSDSSYGFQIRLCNEQPYSRMVFASSDHPDEELHPELEITYTPVNINEADENEVLVYPNPASERVVISYLFDVTGRNISIKIVDMHGNTVQKIERADLKKQYISLKGLNPGVYLLNVIMDGRNIKTSELIVN